MKHLHHIKPRYLGGSDDPENLVELSVEEHSEAHRVLYELHGNKEDWLAWKGLSGILTKEEIVEELCRIGGINGGHKGGSNAVETHKFNKTGLWSDDHWIQKLGAATGAGGKASSKNQQLNKIGIFGYSKEEKSIVSKLGGYAVGRQNGLKLKETKKGIFNPEKKKEWSSMGGKVQKGYKKHRNEDGRWAMALPGSNRSDELLLQGYTLKES